MNRGRERGEGESKQREGRGGKEAVDRVEKEEEEN